MTNTDSDYITRTLGGLTILCSGIEIKQTSRYADQNNLPLPPELVFSVLESIHLCYTSAVPTPKRLKLPDFMRLALVCRAWTGFVRKLSVSSIILHTRDCPRLFLKYYKFLGELQDLRFFVMELDLRFRIRTWGPWKLVINLIRSLPRLKDLKLKFSARHLQNKEDPMPLMVDLRFLVMEIIHDYGSRPEAQSNFNLIFPYWRKMKKLVALHLTQIGFGGKIGEMADSSIIESHEGNNHSLDKGSAGKDSCLVPHFSLQRFSLRSDIPPSVDLPSGGNDFSGSQELLKFSFESLRTLTIGNRTGQITQDSFQQLARFQNLQCLSVFNVDNDTVIPDIPSLRLLRLSASYNSSDFHEIVPNLSTMGGLRDLSIRGGMMGNIPTSPYLLRLTSLDIDDVVFINTTLEPFFKSSQATLRQLRLANLSRVGYKKFLNTLVPRIAGNWCDSDGENNVAFCREIRIARFSGSDSSVDRTEGLLEDLATFFALKLERNIPLRSYIQSPDILPRFGSLQYLHAEVQKSIADDLKAVSEVCEKRGLHRLGKLEAGDLWNETRQQGLK